VKETDLGMVCTWSGIRGSTVAPLRLVILASRRLCLPKKLQTTSESNTANWSFNITLFRRR